MSVFIIFLFLFFPFHESKGKVSFRHKEKPLTIQTYEHQDQQTTRAALGKSTLLTTTRALMGEQFKRAEYHPPFLLLIWGKGIHGEYFLVLDIDKKTTVYEKTSSWPIQVKKTNSSLQLISKGERIDRDTFRTFVKTLNLPRD